jgi:hypothetical protein
MARQTSELTTATGTSKSFLSGAAAFALWFIQWFPGALTEYGILEMQMSEDWRKGLQFVSALCAAAAVYFGRKAAEETGKLAAEKLAEVKTTAQTAEAKADVAVTSAETATEAIERVKTQVIRP